MKDNRVWKCDACISPARSGQPCIIADLQYPIDSPKKCLYDDRKTNWRLTDEYEIKKCQPTQPIIGSGSCLNNTNYQTTGYDPAVTKKRVKIPKTIKSADAWMKFAIEHCAMEGEPITEDFQGTTREDFSWCFSDIPPTWLEDIPPEPSIAEKWWADGCASGDIPVIDDDDYRFVRKSENIKAFDAGFAECEWIHASTEPTT